MLCQLFPWSWGAVQFDDNQGVADGHHQDRNQEHHDHQERVEHLLGQVIMNKLVRLSLPSNISGKGLRTGDLHKICPLGKRIILIKYKCKITLHLNLSDYPVLETPEIIQFKNIKYLQKVKSSEQIRLRWAKSRFTYLAFLLTNLTLRGKITAMNLS